MLTAALSYAAAGLRVLPIYWPDHTTASGCGCRDTQCTDQAKHPLLKHGVKDATRDPEKLRYWWRIWPNANLAIATGNGIAVLDIDDPAYVIEARLHTRLATTSKGLHAYYRVDRRIANRVRVRAGIDIRGEGGYVVAPPSIHATGIIYEWRNPVLPAALAPQWFYDLCQTKTHQTSYSGPDRPFNLEWIKPILEDTRNNQLYRIARRARHGGKDADTIRAEVEWINTHRCEPPLSIREVRKLLGSALS